MNNDIDILQQYYDLSQRVAEAIEAVLRIDVTIMNSDMERISGTGRYKSLIGERIIRKSVFDICLRTGNIQIISDCKKDNPICKMCSKSSTCAEKAEICVPIKKGNKSIGVIGVIAFDEEQRTRIINDEPMITNFLEKMADLLEAKYSEYQTNQENKLLNDRLICALDTMNAGIVLYNSNGDVFYKNKALIKLLDEIGISQGNTFVKEIWKNQILQEILAGKEYPDPCEIVVEHNNEKYALLASIAYLKECCQVKEIIITLQNVNKLRKQMIQSIARNQLKLQFDNILGISECFLDAKRLAEQAALTESNVLIFGESGTGKELFARAIHNHSNRAEHAFVPINCGAIPDELLESELFGYEKGAFTGAYANKIGKFEVADNGTIFLDEISEMPYRLQVKLLRTIQEREISRLGSNNIHKVDVRIIAATNANLMQRIKEGLFRDDLYYRLNIVPVHIPPLRERKADILYLAQYFVQHYSNLLGKSVKELSTEVVDSFMKYNWPGNVRELQGIIECAVNFETGNTIGMKFIGKRLKLNQDKCELSSKYASSDLNTALHLFEKELIENTVKKYTYLNTKEDIIQSVCKDLKVSRATLYRKLNDVGIYLNNEKNLKTEI